MNYKTLLKKHIEGLEKKHYISLDDQKYLGRVYEKQEEIKTVLYSLGIKKEVIANEEYIPLHFRVMLEKKLNSDLWDHIDKNHLRYETKPQYRKEDLLEELKEKLVEDLFYQDDHKIFNEFLELKVDFERDTKRNIVNNNIKNIESLKKYSALFEEIDEYTIIENSDFSDIELIKEHILEFIEKRLDELYTEIEYYIDDTLADRIHEYADSCIPIYTWDLYQYLANNYEFSEVEDSGLLGDEISVDKIIQVSIYEYLTSEGYSILEELKEEIHQTMEA